MKSFTLFLFFTAFHFVGVSAFGAGFYKTQNLNAEIQKFLDEAGAKLPEKLKEQFPEGIEVEFSSRTQAHGKALIKAARAKILLNQSLLEVIQLGEAESKPSLDSKNEIRSHKTQYREALATVLHETAHLYDALNVQSPEVKTYINWCRQAAQDRTSAQPGGACENYINLRSTVSTNPYYLEIAGWSLMPNGDGARLSQNGFTNRSPDIYEFQNYQEHFAVNFEYFLLDSDYACKRPSLFRFLSQHFGHNPFPRTKCPGQLQFVDPEAADTQNLFQPIDLDRVYQVHYLLAEEGTAAMSRFGHSMIRLVICAPGKPMGPACLKDLHHNLVLSFRAFVGSANTSTIAGLTGQYPSRLFVLPMLNVMKEYNEGEYRGLKSFPLKLSRSEIKNVVERAMETHWSYDGKYYFVSNNCATETFNFFKSALLSPKLIDKKVYYPNEVAEILIKENLADNIPKDLKQAIQDGYYFQSSLPTQLASFEKVFGQKITQKKLEEFLERSPDERRELYVNANVALPNLHAFSLERAAMQKLQVKFREQVGKKLLLENASQAKIDENLSLQEIYHKALQVFGALSAPYHILKISQYGIPSREEILDSQNEITETRKKVEEARSIEDQVEEELKKEKVFQDILKTKQLTKDLLSVKDLHHQK